MKSEDSGRAKRIKKKFFNPEGISGYYVDPEFDEIRLTHLETLRQCKIYTPSEYLALKKKKPNGSEE